MPWLRLLLTGIGFPALILHGLGPLSHNIVG
jgi:hypothetical protein